MIISHKYKFIFIKTLKTAGTSIELFLSQFCGPDDIVTPIYPKEDGHYPRNYLDSEGKTLFYNHISAKSIQNRIPKEIWEEYYKFCFERNPWDKTVSHYYFQNRSRYNNQLSFDDYMAGKYFCLNYPIYTDSQNNVLVDKIAKYETIQEDLKDIFSHLQIPILNDLNIYAKSNYRPDKLSYQSFFEGKNKQYIERISQIFKCEIDLHGYTFLNPDLGILIDP